LKFQLNMGQTESLKKIRGFRKDIARVKTIARERELSAVGAGVVPAAKSITSKRPTAKHAAAKRAPAKRKTEKK
jgi:large subunit ribosomal protein L29